jgi:hypothetical protein
MLHIGRTIVHVGEKISSRFTSNKFTSNSKILALLLMVRKNTLVVKFDKKMYMISKFDSLPKCGALEEYQEVIGSSPVCVV